MSGLEVLGGISAVIGIIDGSLKVWDRVHKDLKLGATFEIVDNRLPILRELLATCRTNFEPIANDIPADTARALLKSVKSCRSKADELKVIFEETIPSRGEQWYERYSKVARRLGKGNKVEELLKAIAEDTQNLVNYHAVKSASPSLYAKLEDFVNGMNSLKPSGDAHGLTPLTSSNPVHWIVPRAVNTLFTGRLDLLQELEDIVRAAVHAPQDRDMCRIVISGIGGQGKSEICLQLARRLRSE